jgi:hypothetical protein
MKWITIIICLLLNAASPALCGQVGTIDLCKDNPKTIIGARSNNFRIFGFRLGITHDEAWQILKKTDMLIGEKDSYNPYRIYVYRKNSLGNKGEAILYLIWEPGERELSEITIFQGCRTALSQNFRRLMTFEALDNNSEFKKTFIGYANSSNTTLDEPTVGLKYITFFYDDIGLEITHKLNYGSNEVIFAIVKLKH